VATAATSAADVSRYAIAARRRPGVRLMVARAPGGRPETILTEDCPFAGIRGGDSL
jgi:hypothetical protein